MNVAYLLVSSAWLAGQPPTAPVAPPAVQPAPIVASGAGCGCDGCNTGGDCGCDTGGGWCHRFKNKMRGMFKRGGNNCGCAPAPTCCAPAPAPTCCAPAPAPTCCAPAPTQTCCAPAATTASCGCGTTDCCQSSGWGQRFKSKMKGMFRRHHGSSDCGCATDCGCGTGGCATPYGAGVYGAPAGKVGEQIPAPKDGNLNKMPMGGSEPPAKTGLGGQVQINIAPTAPIPAAAPALQAAPAVTAPAANTEERPF